jgi:AcrR family transcriptional regulator
MPASRPPLDPDARAAPHAHSYHHGNLPQALVDAAVALIDEQGLDALTLRKVARRVGVTHAAPYRHFRDKQALLSAVAAHGYERLAAALLRCKPAAPTIHGAGVLDFARAHPAQFRIMVTVAGGDAEHQHALVSERQRAFDVVRRGVAAKMGSDDRQAVDCLACALWGGWLGTALLIVSGQLPEPKPAPDSLVEAFASIVDDRASDPRP